MKFRLVEILRGKRKGSSFGNCLIGTNKRDKYPPIAPPKANSFLPKNQYKDKYFGNEGGALVKWFKHYSDMHDGQSINNLMDELGHTGLCFFLLQEMCAEKLEGSDATFIFHTRIVRQKLRISQVKLQRLLGVCSANGLLSFEFSTNRLQIKMPILLDLLHRDTKNARKNRATAAQNTGLDRDRDKEREVESVTAQVSPAPSPLFEIWNLNRKKLPEAKTLNASRKRKCDARWRENPDVDFWTRVVQKLADSTFCNGSNERCWIADFDFFLQPDCANRVIEGRYDNRKTSAKSKNEFEGFRGGQ